MINFDFLATKYKAKTGVSCEKQRRKSWKLLAEIQSKGELSELCRENGVECSFDLPHESKPCDMKNLFLESKGKKGFDCSYCLYFRAHSKRGAKNDGELNGILFYQGEHCHAIQLDGSSAAAALESGSHR